MVTVSRLEKTLGGIWTHQNITTSVSWLSLAKHYIKANKIGVVVATTSSTGSKHSPLLSSSAYFKFQVMCCKALFQLCRTFHKTH